MDISRKISEHCIKFITANTDKDEEELEKIKYGIEVILINIFKLFILLITAQIFGIFIYTFIAFISFAFLRVFASGVHANSSIKCIITNYLIFFSIVYLSSFYSLSKSLTVVTFLISLSLIILYAPADTEERPIISKKLRKTLKIKSIACIIFLAIVSLLMKKDVYRNLIAYAALEESIMITPMVYFIFGKGYRNYEKIKL